MKQIKTNKSLFINIFYFLCSLLKYYHKILYFYIFFHFNAFINETKKKKFLIHDILKKIMIYKLLI